MFHVKHFVPDFGVPEAKNVSRETLYARFWGTGSQKCFTRNTLCQILGYRKPKMFHVKHFVPDFGVFKIIFIPLWIKCFTKLVKHFFEKPKMFHVKHFVPDFGVPEAKNVSRETLCARFWGF